MVSDTYTYLICILYMDESTLFLFELKFQASEFLGIKIVHMCIKELVPTTEVYVVYN